jgi:hypothetical protein
MVSFPVRRSCRLPTWASLRLISAPTRHKRTHRTFMQVGNLMVLDASLRTVSYLTHVHRFQQFATGHQVALCHAGEDLAQRGLHQYPWSVTQVHASGIFAFSSSSIDVALTTPQLGASQEQQFGANRRGRSPLCVPMGARVQRGLPGL